MRVFEMISGGKRRRCDRNIFCTTLAGVFAALATLFISSCGSFSPPPKIASSGSSTNGSSEFTVTERHQILFQNGDDSQVFEGYMVRTGRAHEQNACASISYVVQAFAGPGVDLFTIARAGERHKETLHIQSLADRIDVAKIGDDIHRVFMERCPQITAGNGERKVSCPLCGQRAEETFDASGLLIERRFPEAHGIGLTVRYLEYQTTPAGRSPSRIELRWGDSPKRLMVIRVVASEISPDTDPHIFEDALK